MQGLPRRYLLSSVVYLCALLLLLGLALLAGSFTRTVGSARVSGRFSPFPLFNRTSLQSLTVSWNGLDLRFSRPARPGVLSFDTSNAATDIVDGDARLRVSLPDDASGLTISQIADAGGTSKAVLVIPFRVSGVVEKSDGQSTLSWRTGGGTFELSLSPSANIDYGSRTIRLPLGTGLPALRLAALSAAAKPEATPRGARLPSEKSFPTQEQLAAAILHFVDLANAGWTRTRSSASKGTWRMADGSQGFSEDIGIGLLAESIARGTFSDTLQDWNSALDNRQGQAPPATVLSYSSCTYTGSVKDFSRRQQDRDSTEVDRLAGLAARADQAVADQPGVLRYLLDRGGPSSARTVLSAIRRFDVARLSLPQVLNCLESLEDYAQLVGDDAAVPGAARNLVEKRLLPAVGATDEGAVFLRASESGSVDVRQSMRCGSLLLRAGSLLQDSAFSALGRGLIASCVSLADDEGFLPATLSLTQGRLAARDGALAPEAIYQVLPTGRHIPHEVPLYRVLGPGSWVWTAADLVSADQGDGAVRLTFSYPAGVPYHLVFRGVRPFAQIRLHGIPWHADSSYAKYSDGWALDSQNGTLFMKLTGKQEKEEVDIRF